MSEIKLSDDVLESQGLIQMPHTTPALTNQETKNSVSAAQALGTAVQHRDDLIPRTGRTQGQQFPKLITTNSHQQAENLPRVADSFPGTSTYPVLMGKNLQATNSATVQPKVYCHNTMSFILLMP